MKSLLAVFSLVLLAACSGGSAALAPAVPAGSGLDLMRVASSSSLQAPSAALPTGLAETPKVLWAASFYGTGLTYHNTVPFCAPLSAFPTYSPSDGKMYWALWNAGVWITGVAGKGDTQHKTVCWDTEPLDPSITLHSNLVYILALYQQK